MEEVRYRGSLSGRRPAPAIEVKKINRNPALPPRAITHLYNQESRVKVLTLSQKRAAQKDVRTIQLSLTKPT